MELLMCRSCGEFVRAIPDDDRLRPQSETCPECGGTQFVDPESDRRVQTS